MDQKKPGLVAGLVMGVMIGFTVGALASGFLGYLWVKHKEQEVRHGWNLVPVIVASENIGEGEVVTYARVAQRNVPEQFVTASVVKPDSAAYIIGSRLTVPVQQGDMLLWSQFATEKVATPATP